MTLYVNSPKILSLHVHEINETEKINNDNSIAILHKFKLYLQHHTDVNLYLLYLEGAPRKGGRPKVARFETVYSRTV